MKKEKGITLIALVITIVILLILAGITIQALTNQGLFEKADEAKKKTENAQVEEEETLADYENTIGEYVSGTRETITITEEELQKRINSAVEKATEIEEIPITLTDTGEKLLSVNIFSIKKSGNIYTGYFSANFKTKISKNTYTIIGYIDPKYVPFNKNIVTIGNIGFSDSNIEFAIYTNGEIGIRPHIELGVGNWFSVNFSYIH